MLDLHARLLAEIERREDETVPHLPSPHAVSRGLTYLGALREIVEIHTVEMRFVWPTCRSCETGSPCPTSTAVAEALGVAL